MTCACQENNTWAYMINDQGFAMHYMAISNTVSHSEVFQFEGINTAQSKRMD